METGKKVQSEGSEKTKQEIMAERKAKKAEKAAKKSQPIKTTEHGAVTILSESIQSAKETTNTVKADETGKSKADLKAERRQKQEAQRAAKAASVTEGKQSVAPKVQQGKRIPDQIQADRPSVEKRLVKRYVSQKVPQLPPAERKVQLFSHLQQQERTLELLTKDLAVNQSKIHPAVIKLGLQYASGIICGSNARAVALLEAFKRVISDYSTPEQKELSRDLEVSLKPCINFLKQCRPISVSMGNVIRFLKRHITNIPSESTDVQAKKCLHEEIEKYIHENVELAGKTICEEASKKISSGDVILTYGYSSLLLQILLKAFNEDNKKFRVIVLDSSPRSEGLQFLRRLVAFKIPSVYMLISGASYVMPEVNKVFLGAHALLANGNVMSRVGSSQVALVAKAHNVPVLVCCETHKFCDRVQTDSFVFNELGNPDDLVAAVKGKPSVHSIANWRELPKLSLLNLTYDVMPGDLVTAVITELGSVPCTSVPVVLRVKHAETVI
ncbi:translation initiation factor eIF-2B subunit delta isoform X1 [Daphnia magna]|uniref:Translation initiation factor eIF2B subunit delta n=1 Tax=Daphnia magna TaxID=35525 RepID=A0A164X3F7_9CRUS|nr:translation initiation factor eIF-2B subunit delta isoform X1 [Daphnia magna]KZS13833.1 Translation initiation factor eIF-2B subunit delta [Daphnia magna]